MINYLQIEEHHRILHAKLTEILTNAKARQLEYIEKCSRAVKDYRHEKLMAESRIIEMEKEINRWNEVRSGFECDPTRMQEAINQVKVEPDDERIDDYAGDANSVFVIQVLDENNVANSQLALNSECVVNHLQQPQMYDDSEPIDMIEIKSETGDQPCTSDRAGDVNSRDWLNIDAGFSFENIGETSESHEGMHANTFDDESNCAQLQNTASNNLNDTLDYECIDCKGENAEYCMTNHWPALIRLKVQFSIEFSLNKCTIA